MREELVALVFVALCLPGSAAAECFDGTMAIACGEVEDCDPLYCSNDDECSAGKECVARRYEVVAAQCPDFPQGHQAVAACDAEEVDSSAEDPCVEIQVCVDKGSGCGGTSDEDAAAALLLILLPYGLLTRRSRTAATSG